MRTIQTAMMLALCLALFPGASWARGTTVGVGETVPLGGTTTTTTTTNTTTTTAQDEGSSEPTPQVVITPADGSTPSSAEGSSWENSEIPGVGGADGTQQTVSGSQPPVPGTGNEPPQPDGNGEDRAGTSCLPAFILAGMALALFVFRNY
ncbi:MAG: hypothetical protein AB1657_05170 [Candidatus Micrarchaeota archaeon]